MVEDEDVDDERSNPKFAPGWPTVPFEVPAGSEINASSVKDGIKNKYHLERRPSGSNGAYLQVGKGYLAGTSVVIAAEGQNYSYLVGGSYFGDFGTSYGPSVIASSTISADKKTIVVKFERQGAKGPLSTVTLVVG